jgi:hypothetical protein
VSSAVTNEINVFDRPGPRVWVRKFRVVVRIGLARDRVRIGFGNVALVCNTTQRYAGKVE